MPLTRNQTFSQRSLKRSILDRFLHRFSGETSRSNAKRGRLLLESLEPRQLLAGDVELAFTDGTTVDGAVETTSTLQVTSEAEGELAPDLVAFALALDAAGVKFYGANWCPACTLQKEIFQDGADELPFVEVTNPDRSPGPLAISEGIDSYPTWKFPNRAEPVEAVLSLQELSDLSGIAIPQSETPRFETVGNQTVAIGSPFHVPIDVYDPDGGVQTVTVSVEKPELLTAEVLSGNKSLRIDMATYGDMIVELFENRAEVATKRLKDLANANFYNNIIFHRVVNGFVIQAGDPTGTGTSGSGLGQFDDDFHPDLQHNRRDIVSFAKTSDDTNNSQFFITETATRHLDFNHSVVGILTEGSEVREAISNHQTTPSPNFVPTTPIAIESVTVFDDIENSVIMFKATGNGTGSTNVTVTVTDPQGHAYSETFQVTVVNDTANSQPFLNDISVPASFPVGSPAQVQLTSTDIEGDAVTYFASVQAGNVTASVNPTTGLLTVTPNNGFVGEAEVLTGVRPGPGVVGNAQNDSDTQRIKVKFEGEQIAAPSTPNLLSGSDSGSSNSDNTTKLETLDFSVGGVTSGAVVEIVLVTTGSVIGFENATGTSVTITTSNLAALGDGSYELAARQKVAGTTSPLSAPITVVYDSTAPASVTNSALRRANVGVQYQTNLISPEEGNGLQYAIVSGPTGAVIDSATGVITWTPASNQVGQNTFTIALTDIADNTRTESFNVVVAGEPLVGIKLQLTDLAGNEINGVQVGDEFLMNFIGVDARNAFDRAGIFAAFADVFFDPALVRPVPGSSIEFGPNTGFPQGGTFLSGQIDELGSASNQLQATNLEETLLATVRFEAVAAGSVNFLSDPADISSNEVLLYGINNVIGEDEIEFGSASLAIGQNFIVENDSFTVAENSGANTLDVLGNDTVVSGTATLSVGSVTQPTNGGTVQVVGGDVVFTPATGFNGNSVFTYRVGDGSGSTEDGTVTVTVNGVNDPPTGVDDVFEVDVNSEFNVLDVLANDSDAPDSGETLKVVGVSSQTSGATVTVGPNGESVVYTPPTDFVGPDSFSYTLSDGELTTEVDVVVTVAPADPPPTANDNAFTVVEDAVEAEFDVLGNDTRDASNEPFVLVSAQANQGGTVRISDDGTMFFYSPAANFTGTESVVYTIRDTGGGIDTATATFTVSPVDDAPPVINKTVSLNRATGETVVLRMSDLPANVDAGETLTFSNLGTPTAGGSVRIDSNGNILYAPAANFVGTDTFTYNVNDGSDPASTGTVTVQVTDFIPRNIVLAPTSLWAMSRIDGIKLTGTDATGAAVDVALSYDSTAATARFQDLLPGTYQVEIPAIPFLQNASAAQTLTVVSTPEDGDMTLSPVIGRLRPEFVSIRDWLGSTRRQTILAAVAPGADSILTNPSPAALDEAVTEPVVKLDAVGGNVTVTGMTPSGDDYSAELPASSDVRVQRRGIIGDLQLLKISVHPDDAPNQSSTASTAAEGEQISVASTLTTSGAAEGEAIQAAVGQTNVAPNPASDTSLESDLESSAVVSTISPARSDVAASVDAAMQDVAPQLTLISRPGDALAEASGPSATLDDSAVDAAFPDAF